METVMEGIFILGGHVVSQLGVVMSVLLIGLAPIYGYLIARPHLKPRSRATQRVYFGLSLLVSGVITAVLVISGIVLGSWG